MPSMITLNAPSVQQVAMVLMELGAALGSNDIIYLDQMTIGDEAGLPLRSVQRALKVLGDAGVIASHRGRYQVLDAHKLTHVASGVVHRGRGRAKTTRRRGAGADAQGAGQGAGQGVGQGGGGSGAEVERELASLRSDHEALRREVVGLRQALEVLRAHVACAGVEARGPGGQAMMTLLNADEVVAPIVAALELLRVEAAQQRLQPAPHVQPAAKASPAAKVAAKPPQKTLFAWGDEGAAGAAQGKPEVDAEQVQGSAEHERTPQRDA